MNVNQRVSIKVKVMAKFMDKVKVQVKWSQSYDEGQGRCQDQGQVWVGKRLAKNWVSTSVRVGVMSKGQVQ